MTIYFEELSEGQEYPSSGRTITEADIVNFAGVSGDFNALHTDEQWVRSNTPFSGRIAHGLLVLAASNALRTPGIDDWEILAYLDVQRRFAAPTYPGDTISQRSKIESLRPSRSRPGTGVVVVAVEVFNQRGEVVQEGKDTYLVGAPEVAS